MMHQELMHHTKPYNINQLATKIDYATYGIYRISDILLLLYYYMDSAESNDVINYNKCSNTINFNLCNAIIRIKD